MHILDESEIEKTVVERDHALPAPQADASPARPLIGQTRIGGAGLVVDAIGVGGMASVYKVWNERLELFRAVKMLSLDALHARFETEAKITAKLRHPHIVEVYSVGEWNGVPYMEMEYVDGVNLQEALEARGRFPDAVCCAAGLCVASALDYAHTLKFTLSGGSYDGIVHRDLKPANILVSKRSEIKLTDFGIARPAQAGLHTIDGNIVGTLHYLSPEQMGGGKIDPRSDIYSFGAILYEMATGAKTFPQKSITELTMHRAANSFKPPNEYDTPVTPALSNIILKCLKAPPRERYKNAAELISDLRKAYAETAPKTAPQKTLCEFFSGTAEDAGVITPEALMFADAGAGADGVADGVDVVDGDTNVNANVNIDVSSDVSTGEHSSPLQAESQMCCRGELCSPAVGTTNQNSATLNRHLNNSAKRPFKFPTIKLPSVKFPPTKRTTVYAAVALLAVLSVLHMTVKLMAHQSPKTDNKRPAAAANFFSAPADTDTPSIAAADVPPHVNENTAAKAVNTAAADISAVDITAGINTAGVNTADTNAAAVIHPTNCAEPTQTGEYSSIPLNDRGSPCDSACRGELCSPAVNPDSAVSNWHPNNNTNVNNTKAAAPAPPPSESALVKSAAEAISKKEWDRAIRILEKSGAAFTEKRGERHLLLLEAYVESRQLDKARAVLDSAAQTNDALYFLTAGRYRFYRGDHPAALAALEASLTRPSAMRDRGAILRDAAYYIAIIRSDRFKASPSDATRKLAQDAWRRVRSAHESAPDSPRFKRAEEEILELY